MVNISIYKRSLRFEDISSRSEVFYKKVVLINFTKLTGKY